MTRENAISGRDRAGKFVRFLVVGGGFSLGYSIVTAVLVGKADAPPFITSVVLYLICIPAAFAVQKRFTFRLDRAWRYGFLVYAGTQVTCLALVAAVTTRFVTQNVAIDTLIFLATAGSAAVLSFVASSLFAFRPPE